MLKYKLDSNLFQALLMMNNTDFDPIHSILDLTAKVSMVESYWDRVGVVRLTSSLDDVNPVYTLRFSQKENSRDGSSQWYNDIELSTTDSKSRFNDIGFEIDMLFNELVEEKRRQELISSAKEKMKNVLTVEELNVIGF